jgi:hypothetical protein
VPQLDGKNNPQNWIRGGTTLDGDWKLHNQNWEQMRNESYYHGLEGGYPKWIKYRPTSSDQFAIFLDKDKKFSKALEGSQMTWAPYPLVSTYDNNPGLRFLRRESTWTPESPTSDTIDIYDDPRIAPPIAPPNRFRKLEFPLMTELYSVDIVFTSNKDLWTRCPVVEMSDDTTFSIGEAKRHHIRKSPSVDKNGKPDGTGTGMGWFPGYAICVETGERLNIMFGENSSLPKHNGADMIFNPTPYTHDGSRYVMGGGHYIYIMGHRDLSCRGSLVPFVHVKNDTICPAYDEGKWLRKKFEVVETANLLTSVFTKHYIYKNVLWTTIPLASPYYKWLEDGNDAKISLRVSRPYQRWSSVTEASGRSGVGVANPQNDNMPLYRFSTKDMATLTNQKQKMASYMDSIYISPNPYYGMSGYETNQLDTRVKIINLPEKCIIKIFAMDGTLIKTLPKPEGTTYVEWDLKNTANIPISSGMYLIHIRDNNPEYNFEKTLKFLCIQRPIDVNAF